MNNDLNTIWRVSQKVLSSKIDEEVILMSIEADSYFGLDPIASHIWYLLSQKPSTINELVQFLMEEYEVEGDTCRMDVKTLIDDMSARKLIFQVD